MKNLLKIQRVHTLPAVPDEQTVYKLIPHDRGPAFYGERTDRNNGWITQNEQDLLRHSVVGIAGTGGMGGLVAAILVRLGIGEVRIADCETFDVSNLNRQFAATTATIGKSKAFETARMVREIADDVTLIIYPQGINKTTVDSFLEGCDIVCDEIEFWAVGARILLHQRAQLAGVPLLNCSTVGFGTRLFLFDHTGMHMEEMLGFSCVRAYELQDRINDKSATREEIHYVLFAMLNALIPELPEYGDSTGLYRSRDECLQRLREECRAPIIASNPALASGFLADHLVLTLLRHSVSKRSIVRPPCTPGYLYFDAALMETRNVMRKEIVDDFAARRT